MNDKLSAEFFANQWERLKTRFGDKAMDGEFMRLVASEVNTMTEYAFKTTCDVFIGSRTHHKPPLLSDFREARLNYEKSKLDRDANGAWGKILRHPTLSTPLHEILAKNYGEEVTDIKSAFEKAKRKHRDEDPA